MNYIKSYKLFESVYCLEEFVQELTTILSQFNLTAVYIRELISKYDIDSQIENDVTPLEFSKTIIDDLDLNQRGKSGYMAVNVYKPGPDVVKYL